MLLQIADEGRKNGAGNPLQVPCFDDALDALAGRRVFHRLPEGFIDPPERIAEHPEPGIRAAGLRGGQQQRLLRDADGGIGIRHLGNPAFEDFGGIGMVGFRGTVINPIGADHPCFLYDRPAVNTVFERFHMQPQTRHFLIHFIDFLLDLLFLFHQTMINIRAGSPAFRVRKPGQLHAQRVQLFDLHQAHHVFFGIKPVSVFLPFRIQPPLRVIVAQGCPAHPGQFFQLSDGCSHRPGLLSLPANLPVGSNVQKNIENTIFPAGIGIYYI